MKHPLDYLLNPALTLGILLPIGIFLILGLAALIVSLDPEPKRCQELGGTLVKTVQGYECLDIRVLKP
jgi:hypothetical protein